jgi:hypothetical protein
MPISKFSSHFLYLGWDLLCMSHVCIMLYGCVLFSTTCKTRNGTCSEVLFSNTLVLCEENKNAENKRTMHAVPSVYTQHC